MQGFHCCSDLAKWSGDFSPGAYRGRYLHIYSKSDYGRVRGAPIPTGGRTETESYESIGGKGRKMEGGLLEVELLITTSLPKPGGGGGDSEKESGDFLHIALSRQQNNKSH